jgi:hypothetical protein
MNQAELPMDYPRNPASYGTQEYIVYETLVNHGEVIGSVFQNMFPAIPEYRSRINRLRHKLKPLGWWIDSRPVKDSRYNVFRLCKYEERRMAV